MKIERDEEQAAIQWLNRHGEAPGVMGLHTWVSALDAGTCKALRQYLRLRRHRLHAPKVALEITADVHASLSEYVIKTEVYPWARPSDGSSPHLARLRVGRRRPRRSKRCRRLWRRETRRWPTCGVVWRRSNRRHRGLLSGEIGRRPFLLPSPHPAHCVVDRCVRNSPTVPGSGSV